MKTIKRFFRWLLNKDELEQIHKDLVSIRVLLAAEIARQQPKRTYPVGPLSPVQNK